MPPDASQDELDVLDETAVVSEALAELGHQVVELDVTLDLVKVASGLRALAPDFVFNLVESLEGSGRFAYFAPTLLDFLKVPYSGCPTEAIFTTGNKLLTKKALQEAGLPTAPWVTPTGPERCTSPGGAWIIKSIWEHASIGLTGESVVADMSAVTQRLRRTSVSADGDFFAEQYIHGREFNVSMLAGDGAPDLLPVAEILFVDFPQGKPRIVDYKAKWDEESFEYENTTRSFDFGPSDAQLVDRLRELARECWQLFQLRGYARVDFRVDDTGQPWVLEVNTNPCIAKQGGFLAAAARVGLNPADVIARIIADSLPKSTCK